MQGVSTSGIVGGVFPSGLTSEKVQFILKVMKGFEIALNAYHLYDQHEELG